MLSLATTARRPQLIDGTDRRRRSKQICYCCSGWQVGKHQMYNLWSSWSRDDQIVVFRTHEAAGASARMLIFKISINSTLQLAPGFCLVGRSQTYRFKSVPRQSRRLPVELNLAIKAPYRLGINEIDPTVKTINNTP